MSETGLYQSTVADVTLIVKGVLMAEATISAGVAPRHEASAAARRKRTMRRPDAPGAMSARQRLIATATRLFYYEGINSVGVDRITDEAGVAKMSLYRIFGSKEKLVVACLEDLDQRYHDWFVREVEQRGGSAVDKLLAAFDVLDEWFNGDRFRGCAFINATVELANPRHPARGPAMHHKTLNREYIQSLATAAGADDPEELAKKLMLLVEGSIVTALVQDDLHAAVDAKSVATILIGQAVPTRV